MYKAYVFDFDYTLVNSEQGIVMCFEMLLHDEGYAPVSGMSSAVPSARQCTMPCRLLQEKQKKGNWPGSSGSIKSGIPIST